MHYYTRQRIIWNTTKERLTYIEGTLVFIDLAYFIQEVLSQLEGIVMR